MVNWFWRRRPRTEAPKLRSRSADLTARRVELGQLTPGLLHFLGQSAYLQLALFENLSRATANAPTTDAKDTLSHVTALSLTKHHGLTELIRKHGNQPGAVMDPFTTGIDDFQRRTIGADWPETLMTCYLTAGFLDDFFSALAEGLPKDYSERVAAILDTDDGAADLAELLRAQIEANPRLASRLALWGRRLIGDTMLLAKTGLAASANHDKDEERIEPVFTELIAAHTRRMDGLGLTA
ncbi:ferritin-like fold-containing protein [soil metagenome]